MASLSDRFNERLGQGRLPGGGVGSVMARFGWSTRDLAQRLGVSERTARRYRQEDRIPERKTAEWERTRREATTARRRERIERHGLGNFSAGGEYVISKSKYRTGPNSRVRTLAGRIPGSVMKGYFAALDRGDHDQADQILNGALADAYDAKDLHMTEVDDVDFTIE